MATQSTGGLLLMARETERAAAPTVWAQDGDGPAMLAQMSSFLQSYPRGLKLAHAPNCRRIALASGPRLGIGALIGSPLSLQFDEHTHVVIDDIASPDAVAFVTRELVAIAGSGEPRIATAAFPLADLDGRIDAAREELFASIPEWLEGHDRGIVALYGDRERAVLASRDRSGVSRLWDLDDADNLAAEPRVFRPSECDLPAGEDAGAGPAVSDDREMLAAANHTAVYRDREAIWLHDVVDGQLADRRVAVPVPDPAAVVSAVFLPGDETVALVEEARVRLIRVDIDALLACARAVAG